MYVCLIPSLLAESLTELCIELVQLHANPDHLQVSFVLQGPYIVDVAGETDDLAADEEAKVEESMEERVPEEISDFVDQVPVPFAEFDKDLVITSLQNV